MAGNLRAETAGAYRLIYFDSVQRRYVASHAEWTVHPDHTFEIGGGRRHVQGRWDSLDGRLTLQFSEGHVRTFEILQWDAERLVIRRADRRVLAFYAPSSLPSTVAKVGRGILGLAILLGLTWLMSRNRRRISWRVVGWGLALQLGLAGTLLYMPGVREVFRMVSRAFVHVLSFSRAGAEFLFGELAAESSSLGFLFAFQVLPTIIFFSALSALLYHFGVLPRLIRAFSWLMRHTMRISGVESLAAAANIFIGQTEAPLLIRPYLARMTPSELHTLMSGGMATIAGGVLASYVLFLGGADPHQQELFAMHLLIASIISAPAAIVAAKMLVPQLEPIRADDARLERSPASNMLEAVVLGTRDGLRLAVNVGAMLLVFIALVALVNAVLPPIGRWLGVDEGVRILSGGTYTEFNLQAILAVVFAPFAWIMGVPSADIFQVGQLLGEKTVLNEFYAYISLAQMKEAGLLTHPQSILIATYALCGFANFSSIGIQIGGIGSLVPSRQGDLARLGFRSMIAGTLASFYTATIIAMLT